MSDAALPQKLGRYEIVRLLGRGAMGAVFEARDPVIGRTVALKAVNPDLLESEEARARFLREAQAAGSLSHPHIVTLFDVGRDAATKTHFLAMEHLPGGTLRDRLAAGKPLPSAEAAAHVSALLDALSAAHERGIVHRDVKPENILFSDRGVLKLADFGIARPAVSNLTQAGDVLGSPFYMAPEQILGKPLDARADLFAAGAILHEMLSGGKPFGGDTLPALAHAIVYAAPAPLPPSVPPALAACAARLLEKNPGKRFASAAEAKRAVEAALVGDETRAIGSPPTRARDGAEERKGKKPFPALPLAAAVAGLLLCIAAGYMLLGRGKSGAEEGGKEKAGGKVAGIFKALESKERVAFELKHVMSGGEVRVEADGKTVLRESFFGEKVAFVPKPSTHRAEISLRPGEHEIRVHVSGEKGKVDAEAALGIEVRGDETRTLRATMTPGLRSLSLKWE